MEKYVLHATDSPLREGMHVCGACVDVDSSMPHAKDHLSSILSVDVY